MASRQVVAVLGALAAIGCGERGAELPTPLAAVAPAAQPSCAADSLRPVTAAPAEGLWIFEAPAGPRVAAMIGATQVLPGAARVTRRVETLETPAMGEAIRQRAESAAVRLDVLPAFRVNGESIARPTDTTRQPAAVYPVGSLVILAAYEPCAAGSGAPRIRYLRRDAAGVVVADVMLRRASADP